MDGIATDINKAGLTNTVQGKGMTATQVTLAKNVAERLHKHYPGHQWAVEVKDSTINVFNLALSGRWGFVMHISKIDGKFNSVVKAGGELLERYRVTRGAVKIDEIASLKRDFTGNFEVDKG